MSDALTLEIVEVNISPLARPTHSLIVADAAFMTTLSSVEATVSTLKIHDAQSAQQAADLLTRLTGAGRVLEKTRTDLKAPYLALNKTIDDAARGPQARIERLKRTLDTAQTAFSAEQARLAREAEAKRQADLRALELKLAQEKKEVDDRAAAIAEQVRKQAEAAEEARKQAVAAGIPIVEEEVWGEEEVTVPDEPPQKTETEKAIEAVRFAPAVAVVRSSGVREVVILYPFVVDIDQVPDPFITKTFKLAAVQATYCRGWSDGDKLPECPGVRFDIQRSTQSTGRTTF